MAVGDAYVFPGFLTPVLTQLFLPKPPTTFLTCFCRGERRKYAGKKSRLDWGSNSQPQGHESDTLTTEPPRRGKGNANKEHFLVSKTFSKAVLSRVVNPFLNKTWFLRVSIQVLKTLKKEKLLIRSNFSFSQCFLPVWRTFCHFHQI